VRHLTLSEQVERNGPVTPVEPAVVTRICNGRGGGRVVGRPGDEGMLREDSDEGEGRSVEEDLHFKTYEETEVHAPPVYTIPEKHYRKMGPSVLADPSDSQTCCYR
jgi:hypothetical protein